jgi:hypothetical protein
MIGYSGKEKFCTRYFKRVSHLLLDKGVVTKDQREALRYMKLKKAANAL